jgi:hypothetical protein
MPPSACTIASSAPWVTRWFSSSLSRLSRCSNCDRASASCSIALAAIVCDDIEWVSLDRLQMTSALSFLPNPSPCSQYSPVTTFISRCFLSIKCRFSRAVPFDISRSIALSILFRAAVVVAGDGDGAVCPVPGPVRRRCVSGFGARAHIRTGHMRLRGFLGLMREHWPQIGELSEQGRLMSAWGDRIATIA